jgi:hypothetical protein
MSLSRPLRRVKFHLLTCDAVVHPYYYVLIWSKISVMAARIALVILSKSLLVNLNDPYLV